VSEVVARLTAALADRYRIERELGAGGMATVYLAEDVKHHRQVAVKVLKPELAAAVGAERFLREIETTANLRHPHILPLYDSGEVGGFLFYVMPFVEGEPLADRLKRERQLPLEEALRIAREVADALAYANNRGVIHRDIKPANILLDSGHALVADFGVALALQSAGGERMTQTGMSIGTPQYMSPEQAAGDRAVDARSDVYALGAVTYEMLTGEPPFQGVSAQAIFAKAVTERPTAPSTVRDTVPEALDAVVFKALARLPADRFASASAFATAITTVEHTGSGLAPLHRARRLRGPMALGLGLAALIAAAGSVGYLIPHRRLAALGRFGQAAQVTWKSGLEITPAISPDGKLVAYAAGDGARFRIYIRPVAGGRDVPLTDDSTAVEISPEWSHDGSRLLFLSNGQVYSAPSGGGPARQEVPNRGADVESAAWSPDERQIVYVVADSIFVQDASGSSRRIATAPVPSMCRWGPRGLIACHAGNWAYLKPGMVFGNVAPSWITIVDPETGRVTGVSDSLSSNVAPVWTPDGRTVLFVSNRLGPPDIYAVRLNGQGAAAGDPQRLTVGMNVNSFSLSADGTRLAYTVMHAGSNIYSQPWNHGTPPTGAQPIQVTFGEQVIEGFSVSRDGQWLYFDSDASGNPDIYRMRMPGGEPEPLTTARSPEFNPAPSPDGTQVAFHSWRTGSRDIYVMPLDGGHVVQVTHSPEQEQYVSWSPDGRSLAFASQSEPLGVFIAHRDDAGAWHTRKLVNVGHWCSWSPDGQSLAYVTALSGGGLRVIPSDSGTPRALYDETAPGAPQAEASQWSDDERTIYFRSHDADGEGEIWSVPASGGTPKRILRLGYGRLRSDRYGFRVAKDRLYYTLFNRQSNIWVMDIIK
jgi:Tol biopolymer transport system component/tRNA A-37 threonylcarbamoyl transferase component Bud32